MSRTRLPSSSFRIWPTCWCSCEGDTRAENRESDKPSAQHPACFSGCTESTGEGLRCGQRDWILESFPRQREGGNHCKHEVRGDEKGKRALPSRDMTVRASRSPHAHTPDSMSGCHAQPSFPLRSVWRFSSLLRPFGVFAVTFCTSIDFCT